MKHFYVCLMLLVSCIMFACSDEKVAPEITPNSGSEIYFNDAMNFSSDEGTNSLRFSTNKDWVISIANTVNGTRWCTVSQTSGQAGDISVQVHVDANEGYDDRNVVITIQVGELSKTVMVTQKQKDALTLTSDRFEVGQEGGTINVEVKANISYEVIIPDEYKDWITQEAVGRGLVSSDLSFEIAASQEYEKREGEIIIQSGELFEVIKVYQTGGGIILLSESNINVSDKGETIAVEIKSNCDFEVKMPDADWIMATNVRSISSHTLYYTVSPNETYDGREAEIVFFDRKNRNVSDTLHMRQVQKDAILLSEKKLKIDYQGGEFTINVNANVDIEVVMPDVFWLSNITSWSRGLVNHRFVFSIANNDTKQNRETQIIFCNRGTNVADTLIVQQNREVFLEIYADSFDVPYLEYEPHSISVWTNSEFELTKPDWIQITSIEKSVDGMMSYISYTIDKNMSRLSRTGELVFSVDDIPIDSIRITQFSNPIQMLDNTLIADIRPFFNMEKNSFLRTACLDKNIDLSSIEVMKLSGYLRKEDYGFINSLASAYSLKNIDLSRLAEGNSIPNNAFSGCSKLTTVALPDSCYNAYGFYAFKDCVNLKTVIPPKPYIENRIVDNGCFRGCINLETIILPKEVIAVDSQCFYYTRLKEIHCQAKNPPKATADSFNGDIFFESVIVYVPQGSKILYETSAGWSLFKNIIEE
jgi:hypothetical protein